MMIVLLVFVEAVEVHHAGHDLLRYGQLVCFVRWPVACRQDLNVEFNWILFNRPLLNTFRPVVPVRLRLILRELQVIHHAFNAVGHLPSTINLQLCHNTPLVLNALGLLAEQSACEIVLEGLDEDVLIRKMCKKLDDSFELCLILLV